MASKVDLLLEHGSLEVEQWHGSADSPRAFTLPILITDQHPDQVT